MLKIGLFGYEILTCFSSRCACTDVIRSRPAGSNLEGKKNISHCVVSIGMQQRLLSAAKEAVSFNSIKSDVIRFGLLWGRTSH